MGHKIYRSSFDSIRDRLYKIQDPKDANEFTVVQAEVEDMLVNRAKEETLDDKRWRRIFARLRIRGTIRDLENFLARAESLGALPGILDLARRVIREAEKAHNKAPAIREDEEPVFSQPDGPLAPPSSVSDDDGGADSPTTGAQPIPGVSMIKTFDIDD